MAIYLCPTDVKHRCSWEGRSEDILNHFELEHDDLVFYVNTLSIDVQNASENRLCLIDEEIYLAQSKIEDGTLSIFLRYLGPRRLAAMISYTVDVMTKNETLDPSHFRVSNGSLEVDLTALKGSDGNELRNIQCTFNIVKNFSGDGSEKEEQEDLIEDFDKIDLSPVLMRKRSLDNNLTQIVDVEDGEEDIFADFSLSRSKTVNFQDVKRKNFIVKRARSISGLDSILENELDIICTNCDDVLVPPILICPCEHNFCLNCQGSTCKYCLKNVTELRNIDLEEKCIRFLHPCRYKKQGCPVRSIYTDLKEHEIDCSFCEYRCPMEGCGVRGQFRFIYHHLKLIHGSIKILESFIVVFQNTPEVFLANEEKGIFYCYYKIMEDHVLWEAKFCGPKHRRFFCELKFKEGKLRKPVILTKVEDTYSTQISFQELKKQKLKSKNAVLTITKFN